MKVDIDLTKMVMMRNGLDVRTVAQIIEDIHHEVQQQTDDEAPPPIKKQLVMMVADPEGKLEGIDLVGWVLQIPEEDSPHVTEERLFSCAYEYNMTPKGRRLPLRKISEVCEFVSARISKGQNVWIKNREPILLLRTNNRIPMDRA